MNEKKFLINELVDLTENNSFSLVNDEMENQATVLIKDEQITIYFENKTQEDFGSDYNALLDRVNDLGYHFVKLMNGAHRWHEYNPNPNSRNIGDCSLRSYCAAFGITWDEAFDIAAKVAKRDKFMLNDGKVCKTIITEEFGAEVDEKYAKTKAKDRITVNEFAMTHPYGTFILSIRGHLVCVKDGEYWDSWDSGEKKVVNIYKVS